MPVKNILIATTLLVGFGVGALYGQAKRPYTVYGIGETSCGTWTKTTKAEYRWWVLGYISGVTRGGMQLRNTDPDAIEAWMDKYCADHPLDLVATAAHMLVDELKLK